jgi:hypothetical protein
MNALMMQACRREAQNAFARNLVERGTAVSDLTPAERAEAEHLGWTLPTFRPRRENAAPVAWSGRVL